MKNASVYDVAQLAGVSVSSISRYLNRSAAISEAKRDAIEQAMSALHFVPKVRTQRILSTPERVLGVSIPTFDNTFIASLLDGMDAAAQNSAYRLHIETSNWDKARERKNIRRMLKQGVAGMIILVRSLSEAEIKRLTGALPVLILTGFSEGMLPCLKVDNFIGGKIATDHLIRLGHKKIVHIHGIEAGNFDSTERIHGYKASLQAAGIAFEPSLLLDGGYEAARSSQAIQRLIDDKVGFSAVFAANDLSAYGVIQTLRKNNIRVPEQVSVVGFDDLFTSSIFVPKLSTVRQPLEDMGKLALQYMQDLLNGLTPCYSPPAVELIVRDSCTGAPPQLWNDEHQGLRIS